MAEREKSWLPEGYSRFHQIDSQFQKWRLPSRAILATWILASTMAVLNPEYATHYLQPYVWVIEWSTFFLTVPNPAIPNFNFVGRRLRKQLSDVANEISQNEGLTLQNPVPRIRKTLSLTGRITPLNPRFNWKQTPKQMLAPFPNESSIRRLSLNEAVSARKALYLGEAYWKELFEHPNLPLAKRNQAKNMLDEIKNHLAVLSIDRHFSF